MPEPNRNDMIAELNEKLSSLGVHEETLASEAGKFAEKRDKLNELVRSLRGEVLDLRTQRDELNKQVKELKQHRDEMRAYILEKIDEMKKLREQSTILAKKKPSEAHKALQKEVESIDWTIQTSSLTLQEDRELVEKVKGLEAKLSIYRKLKQLAKAIDQLRTETLKMKAQTENLHTQLSESAQKSQEIHRKMLEKIDESKKLKAEADSMHKKFAQAKDAARPIREEMKTIRDQISLLQGEILGQAQREHKQSEDALRETLENRAREKLKRGEKLTWEEFQLLAEKGITEQC